MTDLFNLPDIEMHVRLNRTLDAIFTDQEAKPAARSAAQQNDWREISIDTPTGMRVMEAGEGYCLFRAAHAPTGFGNDARKRLLVSNAFDGEPVGCADGVHIQPRQLLSGLCTMAPRGHSATFDQIGASLFFCYGAGDLWRWLRPAVEAWDMADPWCREAGRWWWIDCRSQTLHFPMDELPEPIGPVW